MNTNTKDDKRLAAYYASANPRGMCESELAKAHAAVLRLDGATVPIVSTPRTAYKRVVAEIARRKAC